MFEDGRLKIFFAVVECGSFTAAARKLGITQPSVSQNIAELEKEMGTQFFVRSRSEVSLTPEGELFMGYARQINHWYGTAWRAFHPDPLAIRPEPVRPLSLRLGDGSEVLVWTSEGDIHIELGRKQ